MKLPPPEDPFKDLREKKQPWPPGVPYTVYSAQPAAKPLSLIEGLLDGGGRILVGGSSKTFKTWLILDLCLSQVSGTQFLNTFDCHPYPVLYVNFELKSFYLKSRIARIAEAKALPADCLGEFFIWDLRGIDFWTLDGFIEELKTLIERHSIKLVVIDPYYKLLSRQQDENSQTDMAATLRQFNPVNSLGASILYAMHFSKGNQAAKNPEDRISGAGSTIRDCDGLITLTAHEEPLAFVADFILRDFAPLGSFVLKWRFPLLVKTDLDPGQLRGRPGPKEKYSRNSLLDLLERNDGELSPGEFRAKALEELGISKPVFYRKYSPLVAGGRIKISPLNGKLFLNPLCP